MWSSNAKDEREGTCDPEATPLDEILVFRIFDVERTFILLTRFGSRGLYWMPVVELFSLSLRLSRTFTRLTAVLFVLMDGRVKNGGCAKVGDHCDGRHIHKKAWYGILIYAADRVGDRWQGRCSLPIPIYLSLTMDSISATVFRGIPYRTPTLLVYRNHAGTGVGNTVDRTPQRNECRTRFGIKDRHTRLWEIYNSRRCLPDEKVGVIFMMEH
jgi:hypothetical protein